MSSKIRVALCQMLVGSCKQQNIAKAVSMIAAAKRDQQADLVVLPECFNSPYGTKFFPEYAEPIAPGNETFDHISAAARDSQVCVIAGSIPERQPDGTLYNSSMIFDADGKLMDVYRKIHLFKIHTPALSFDEGEVLTAGSKLSVVRLGSDGPLFGIGICFDIRFPQEAIAYTERGTSFLVYPGAFNMVTGPAHWELLARARAVDNQQFVLLCSPARDEQAGYVAWGHSLVVDPWGNVLAEASEKEETIVCDIDLSLVSSTRDKVPSLKGTRRDLYTTEWK